MTDPNEPYLRRAQEALDAAKAKVSVWKGNCDSCVYQKTTFLGGQYNICTHPAVELVAFNLTDAHDKETIVQCGEQRDRDSIYGPVVCGPNGALYEAKP